MDHDNENQYRPLLEKEPPEFVDRVDTPWDHVPDLPEYNGVAYRRIVRDLERIRRDNDRSRGEGDPAATSSRGVLVLGEAGTGKTHLLMRVARNLSESNHILFVRKPNNEEAVAQHIWANIVSSLTRTLPTSATSRSQLDDLLAHVFSHVLIPEFERDIEGDINVEQRQRWVSQLRADPYNLFLMLGEGERRQDNLRAIRKRTLRYMLANHPDVDQRIAHALITYCFVTTPDRKRLLLTWLAGQDIDETEAQTIGLPPRWVEIQENSTDISTQQQSEEQALRAIRTIGTLSTHYQPLILAFDQLEGLRGEDRLTCRWGDVVREIFTMTPNFLVVTCIFPSLWESWFKKMLDQSAAERISQQVIELEKFGPQHGLSMLKTQLEQSFDRYRLPTNIYPFTSEDLSRICTGTVSPRMFIQKARSQFEAWLDHEEDGKAEDTRAEAIVVTQDAIDNTLKTALDKFENEQRVAYGHDIPIEQDFFGRIKNLTQTILTQSGAEVAFDKAQCGTYVMPLNLVVKSNRMANGVCLAVMNGVGNAFAARARNLNKVMQLGQQFGAVVILRDRRCRQIGARSQEYVSNIEQQGGVFIHAGVDEIATLNALYDTLVEVEEHDPVP
jgi:Cdc6-like AAA superfamily ATPase